MRAEIYRKAAKRMEHAQASYYPCWCIAQEEGDSYANWESSKGVRAFLRAFSACERVHDMSDHYIHEVYRLCGHFDNDFHVLALCFMAAMVEAGDA